MNVVNLEDYLRGVVPNELSPRAFPQIEALKAQAVAVRTYALAHFGDYWPRRATTSARRPPARCTAGSPRSTGSPTAPSRKPSGSWPRGGDGPSVRTTRPPAGGTRKKAARSSTTKPLTSGAWRASRSAPRATPCVRRRPRSRTSRARPPATWPFSRRSGSTTLRQLVQFQEAHSGPFALITLTASQPRGFGRIIRDASGEVQAIVEEAAATEDQLRIDEVNAGIYCFHASWLWQALPKIQLSRKGEYYLTDLVEIAVQEGLPVNTMPGGDEEEFIGINNRLHLSQAEAALRRRINEAWMLAGVSLIDPASAYIDVTVKIGQDTVIWPNTCLQGQTVIGTKCQVGPNTILRDTQVGHHCKILASVLEEAVLDDHVDVGPFGHLRKGAHLAEGVHMGNFGEVKNSFLAPGVKMGHTGMRVVATGIGGTRVPESPSLKRDSQCSTKFYCGAITDLVASTSLFAAGIEYEEQRRIARIMFPPIVGQGVGNVNHVEMLHGREPYSLSYDDAMVLAMIKRGNATGEVIAISTEWEEVDE